MTAKPYPSQPATRMNRLVPVLPALDVIETLEFYTQVLGFTDSWTHDANPVSYGGVSSPLEIHFFRSENPDIAQWTSFRIGVNGLDALYERAQARGIVHPQGKLEVKPWGLREFSVIDPNGVLIHFFEEDVP